jgi:hypothetical protein
MKTSGAPCLRASSRSWWTGMKSRARDRAGHDAGRRHRHRERRREDLALRGFGCGARARGGLTEPPPSGHSGTRRGRRPAANLKMRKRWRPTSSVLAGEIARHPGHEVARCRGPSSCEPRSTPAPTSIEERVARAQVADELELRVGREGPGEAGLRERDDRALGIHLARRSRRARRCLRGFGRPIVQVCSIAGGATRSAEAARARSPPRRGRSGCGRRGRRPNAGSSAR